MGLQLEGAIQVLELLKIRGRVVTDKHAGDLQDVIDMLNGMLKKTERRQEENKLLMERSLSPVGTARNDAITKVLQFVSASWENIPKQYQMASDDYERTSGVVQDILHELEFLPDVDYDKKGREITAVRRHRREVENYMELVEPLVQLMERYPNLARETRQVISKIDQTQDKQSKRKYAPRELTALALAFQQVEATANIVDKQVEPSDGNGSKEDVKQVKQAKAKPRKGFSKRNRLMVVRKRQRAKIGGY
ncbi:hypothetical protein [Bacillus thuringiensis]|uniref:hypothetical protein n=1 Tax=Bacillus thuringiensis TaxID=1428 RepID=UPI000BFDEBBD|nr:hypothetical protein [Bacillus thuringiensis]PGT89876.1 hypothetical protein COD17_08995 [Bacillus thuringiensis]